MLKGLTLFGALTLLTCGGARAAWLDHVDADLRYRLESVDQAGFDDDALASTLRTRLGVETSAWRGFSAYAGFEDIHTIGGDRYNSTENGRTELPVVADPPDTELDQAWIAWKHQPLLVKAGRQKINLDNQRFVGAVGFRQNQQTFDGATATIDHFGGTLFCGYLANANRVFGEHHPDPARSDLHLRAHLANYGRAFGPVKATAYAYFLKLPDAPAASHRDLGLRVSGEPQIGGSHWRIPFALEYARQSPWSDAADTVSADYVLAEAGARYRDTTAKLGYEVLGGDGTYGFATPLATLHAFNGWADRFLTTPAGGLRDRYAQLLQNYGPFDAAVVYHDFRADDGAQHYGDEWNATLGWRANKHLSTRVEYANYRARDLGVSIRIVWFTLQANL